VSHERLLALEKSGEWFDTELWSEIARAGLTALAIPEAFGGGGLGIEELCAVFEEQGRHTAPVPLLATAVLGALPIAEFGTPEQRERWLRPVAEQEAVLSAALIEYASSDPGAPRTTAKQVGGAWRIDGEKQCVPAADRARVILVPARTPDGVAVFAVDPRAAGVSLERQEATHREPQWRVQLAGAPAELLGTAGQGEAIVAWIADRAALALAAIQIGVAEEAMRRTAKYIAERKQFGKAIATFQGVALRAGRRVDRRRGAARRGVPGGVARRGGPARDDCDRDRKVGGRRPRARVSCTPRSTCTAGSARTSSTRSTASSCGRSRTSSCSAARASRPRGSARTSCRTARRRERGAAREDAALRRGRAGRGAARARGADHRDGDRLGRDRIARLSGRAPRRRARAPARLERHLHEHPDHERLGRALCHRLGGPRGAAPQRRHPARRAQLSRRHDGVLRHRLREARRCGQRSRCAARTSSATT
jgi:alkylation response protein AidB-like acyl-CoA dehydrogenase